MAEDGFEFSRGSRLAAAPAIVWAHATSMVGVNREFFPLLRMTYPSEADRLDASRITLGQRLFRSWLLLFGVLPIDYDDLTIVQMAPGRFLERSTMLTQRVWQHERTVVAIDGGCEVVDRVRFVPRLQLLGVALLPVFRFAFWFRHRNLRRQFGAL